MIHAIINKQKIYTVINLNNESLTRRKLIRALRNWAISILILGGAWLFCSSLRHLATTDVHVPLIFVLAVLLISLTTDGYFYGILASLVSVLGVNWAFTYPYMKIDFSIAGYPMTFLVMLAVSLVISTLTTRVHEHEKLRHESEQEKLRANLLRSISHDLRTPLTSIIGSITTVIESDGSLSDQNQKMLLNDAKSDAEWLIRMVENLLSITRISGTESANITKLPELLEEIIGECCVKFKKRNPDIELDIKVPDKPVMVSADAMLIEQVIINLMDNAVHHGKTTSRISVHANASEHNAIISVADNGQGIDTRIINKLFKGQLDPVDGGVDSNRFRGIGLAVCKTIVNAHGGEIFASNRPEGGAEFRFTLPMEDIENEHQG